MPETKPITPQKVRAVLRKAGFKAAKQHKIRASQGWRWAEGYKVREYGVRGALCVEHLGDNPESWRPGVRERIFARYRAALAAVGIACHMGPCGLIIGGEAPGGEAGDA